VSEESVALDQDASPERTRYRVLLEITDLIAHAKSLPEAFKETGPPGAGSHGMRVVDFTPTTTRAGTCSLCSASYWKKRRGKVESSTLFRSNRSGDAGGHGNIRRTNHHSGHAVRTALSRLCAGVARSWRSIDTVLPMSHLWFILGRSAWQEGCRGAPCRRCRSPFTHCGCWELVTLGEQEAAAPWRQQQSLAAISAIECEPGVWKTVAGDSFQPAEYARYDRHHPRLVGRGRKGSARVLATLSNGASPQS